MNPWESRKNQDKRDVDDPSDIRVTDRRRVYLNNEGELDAGPAEPTSLKPSYVEELEARTKAAEKLTQEVQSRFEQLRAKLQQETDETRQRLNRAADERAQRDIANFIASLLPVLDNLERATEAAASGSTAEQISEGVSHTATSFGNVLAAAGLEAIDSVEQEFNPELHEAVETAEVKPELEGKVIAEYSRGYRLGDRLLRPARVKVGRFSDQARTAAE